MRTGVSETTDSQQGGTRADIHVTLIRICCPIFCPIKAKE